MALSTTQYGYIIDPMVPFTDGKGNTIKDGFVRVFVAGSSTPVITYRNFDGEANQDLIELDNSGRTKTSVIGSKGLTYKVCVYDKHHSQESPILTVDKVSVIGANITAGAGATVVTGLDGLTTKPNGFVDASVVGTDGYVALDHTLVTDDLDTDAKATAVENDRYIPLLNDDVNDPDSKITLGRLWQWVLGKIKSLSTTITTFRTGDVIPVDGPSGTAKMSKDDLLKETAENALGSIHSLSDVATEADLVSGNYLALDGTNGTKKLPAELIAKESSLEDTDERTWSSKYNEIDITMDSSVVGKALNANMTYMLAVYQPFDGTFSDKIYTVEKGKKYLAKNAYGNLVQPFSVVVASSLIPDDGAAHTFAFAKTNGGAILGKRDVEFTSPVDGYAYIVTKTSDMDASLCELDPISLKDYTEQAIPDLQEDVSDLQEDVSDLQTAVEISEKKTIYNAVTMDSSVVGKAMMPNEQYHLTFYQAALSGTVSTKIYPIENGKTYIARNVYGYKTNPSGVLIATTLIPEDTPASSYTQRWFNGLVNLGKADVQFTSTINGYAYITTLTADDDASLDEVTEVPYTIEEYVDKESNYNNQWFGKKIVWIGTSVPFGSNATTSYVKVAQDILGFDVVNASIPGEALHCAVSGATPYPLTYGSTCLSKAEYVAAKAAGLSNIEIADSPIEPWTPGGNYNSYYRCWDNVITVDNEDADLWVLDVVPNNSSYALTDWELFNVDTWSYNDSSDFADHRTTFLGALLFLLDKIYTLNPKARIVLLLGSNFNYTYGLSNFEKLKEKNVAVIDVWSKINKLKPSLDVVKSMGGTDWHPSNFGHECLGKMLANELLLIA